MPCRGLLKHTIGPKPRIITLSISISQKAVVFRLCFHRDQPASIRLAFCSGLIPCVLFVRKEVLLLSCTTSKLYPWRIRISCGGGSCSTGGVDVITANLESSGTSSIISATLPFPGVFSGGIVDNHNLTSIARKVLVTSIGSTKSKFKF